MGFGVQTELGECLFCLGIIGMKYRSEINLAFFGSKSLYLGQPRGEENSEFNCLRMTLSRRKRSTVPAPMLSRMK